MKQLKFCWIDLIKIGAGELYKICQHTPILVEIGPWSNGTLYEYLYILCIHLEQILLSFKESERCFLTKSVEKNEVLYCAQYIYGQKS